MTRIKRGAWFGCVALVGVGFAGAAAARQPIDLTIDARESRVAIDVGKAGVFGFAGHAHQVMAPDVRGHVTVDASDWQHSTVSLEFESAALRVSGAGEPPADVPEVQRVMVGERVLNVQRFPTVTFRSTRVAATPTGANAADMQIEGDLTLHGVTRPITVRATTALDPSGVLTTRGAFTLKQTDFNIEPVTAAGGSVRVRDDVDVQFLLKAHR